MNHLHCRPENSIFANSEDPDIMQQMATFNPSITSNNDLQGQKYNLACNYRHTLKKGGYTGFGLFVILSVRHNFISTQYLENKLIEFNQNFLYALILMPSR